MCVQGHGSVKVVESGRVWGKAGLIGLMIVGTVVYGLNRSHKRVESFREALEQAQEVGSGPEQESSINPDSINPELLSVLMDGWSGDSLASLSYDEHHKVDSVRSYLFSLATYLKTFEESGVSVENPLMIESICWPRDEISNREALAGPVGDSDSGADISPLQYQPVSSFPRGAS